MRIHDTPENLIFTIRDVMWWNGVSPGQETDPPITMGPLGFFSKFLFPSVGASGVGRSHIKNALIRQNPDKFVYPAPCK